MLFYLYRHPVAINIKCQYFTQNGLFKRNFATRLKTKTKIMNLDTNLHPKFLVIGPKIVLLAEL